MAGWKPAPGSVTINRCRIRSWRCRGEDADLIAVVEKRPDAKTVLAAAGAGPAHLGWRLMHIGATDDQHLYVRMRRRVTRRGPGARFAGGSVVDDDVPSLEQTRYNDAAGEILQHLDGLSRSDLSTKPNDKAPWTYLEWFQVLAWHEAHHQPGPPHVQPVPPPGPRRRKSDIRVISKSIQVGVGFGQS